MNINSKEYWDQRFGTGHWAEVGGNAQTEAFAKAQARRFQLPPSFAGTLLDFGCGAGDALPVYRSLWPSARLSGVDFSAPAIEIAQRRHGHLGTFSVGTHHHVPNVDVIVTSNVLEHLPDDDAVLVSLLSKCALLYVTVPYREQYLIDEHLRRYDRASFSQFTPTRVAVFACAGWSQYGVWALWWEIRVKNLLRPLWRKTRLRRRMQVLYSFRGALEWNGPT